MTVYELSQKDVIQIQSGENLGRVDDLVFEQETARISHLVLRGRPRWLGLFGRDEDLEIAWKDVQSIGADVIMVDVQPAPGRTQHPRRRCFG